VAALRERLAGRALALVFDKALSYGYQGPIAEDLKAALYAAPDPPAVYGAICGLGGRDVSPGQLATATREALADLAAGVTDRDPVWINLAEGSMR
jgi:pyruvate/2-oxoacid:ferredoxin oxidoreductase alpha subunit